MKVKELIQKLSKLDPEWDVRKTDIEVIRYFVPELPKVIIDGQVTMVIRNGDDSIFVGDWFGMAKIIKLEAYGKELPELGCGMTGRVTFDRMPMYNVIESDPATCEEFDRIWPHRIGKTSNATEQETT